MQIQDYYGLRPIAALVAIGSALAVIQVFLFRFAEPLGGVTPMTLILGVIAFAAIGPLVVAGIQFVLGIRQSADLANLGARMLPFWAISAAAVFIASLAVG